MSYETLLCEVKDHVGRVTLNRPEVLNALNAKVFNELEHKGIFSRYAIGGAMGAIFYTEPFLTFDLDVFVVLPTAQGGLLTLAPIYDALRARGYAEEANECVVIAIPPGVYQ